MTVPNNLSYLSNFIPAPSLWNNLTSSLYESPAPAFPYKETKETAHVFHEKSFDLVKPGNFIFFRHLNSLTHLVIKKFQEWQGADDFTNEITHVGVVTEVLGNHVVKVGEIPYFGAALSENEYNLKDLFVDEELLFGQDSSTSFELNQKAAEVTKLWSKQKRQENQYNLAGLIQIPFTEETFNDQDKESLLNAYLDYIYFKRSPHDTPHKGVIGLLERGLNPSQPESLKSKDSLETNEFEESKELKPKKFFCSEYSLQAYQLSRILQLMPSLPETFRNLLESHNLNLASERKHGIEILKEYTEKVGIWKELTQDFLYKFSPKSITPSSLMRAFQYSKMIRVENPDAVERGSGLKIQEIPDKKVVQHMEYLVTKIIDGFLDKGYVHSDNKHVKELIELLGTRFGYSKEMVNCWEKCFSKSDQISFQVLNKCAEKCLDTLKWDEKLYLFLLSRQINRAIEEMLSKPAFLDFIKQPNKENFNKLDITQWNLEIETILNTAFPMKMAFPFKSLENHFAKKWMLSRDRQILTKYLPLAIIYSPPTETVVNFLKKHDIDIVSLALHFQSIHSMLSSSSSSSRKGIEALWSGISALGLLEKNHPVTSDLIKKLASKSGYSEETLSCLLEESRGRNIDAKVVEKCLLSTLTIKEKLGIVASSYFANLGIENCLLNQDFRDFIRGKHSPALKKKELLEMKKEDLLEFFFPSGASGIMRNGENLLGRYFFDSSIERGLFPFLFKDLFLGIQYDLNSEVIKNFLEEEKLTKEALMTKLANWLAGI